MLVMNGNNINYNAKSQREDGTQLATMTASYYGGPNVNFSLSIDINDEQVDTDFIAFKNKVFTSIASIEE